MLCATITSQHELVGEPGRLESSRDLIPSCIMRSFDLRSTPLTTTINSQYLKQPWTQTLTVTMLNPTPYSSKSYLAIRTHAKYLNQDLGNIPK
ncbi:hypothetical protein Agabi119p4_5393 [Agaricus bisporus var. burnettii]|uniref:Uncharacterized protein n=1 Tax=Agaricus bisporus var. burnettii TaxID=192524 RepID=A0A8H7F1L2_AGABI|nr:hypothetical protein Agabi119p4_5393 [Agaricus bisporus var. burnettii]